MPIRPDDRTGGDVEAMRTRTVFTPWNQVEDQIRAKERDGWGVRLIVPAKRPKLSSTTGVEDGFLVVFEKELRVVPDWCTDCVDGRVPPDGMVEAAYSVLMGNGIHELPIDESDVRRALVAAARWEAPE